MASENSARNQPNSSAMGIWNTPKLARTAKQIMMMMHDPISTGVNILSWRVIGTFPLRSA